MAEEKTPRFGLDVYSSGLDPHPNRQKFNASRQLLEQLGAIARQGSLSARPPAGIGGQLYCATDQNNQVYFDNGTQWVEISPVGGVTPLNVVVGGAAKEGTSHRSARADHVHTIPLATTTAAGAMSPGDKTKLNNVHNASNLSEGTVPPARLPTASQSTQGAMSAADKAKLDGAMSSPTANTVMSRDSDGQVQVLGPPKSINYVANKAYVDAEAAKKANTTHNHTAAQTNSGVFAPARLPAATQSAQGAMSAADKKQLDDANSGTTANTLVQRASNGAFQVVTPAAPTHPTPKSYVDGEVAKKADSTHNHTAAQTNSGVFAPARLPAATQSAQGAMSAADKKKLDSATVASAGGTIPLRDSSGAVRFSNVAIDGTPVGTNHAVTKGYTDTEVAKKANTTHNHTAAQTTSGVFSAARIPVANASTHGALSTAFWKLLNEATYAANGDTIMKRMGNGQTYVADPTAAPSAANKRYVDGLFGSVYDSTPISGKKNLNNYVTPGPFTQSLSADAELSNNYPTDRAGHLMVWATTSASMVWQIYIVYGSFTDVYVRGRYGGTWGAWKQMADMSYVYSSAASSESGNNAYNSYTTPGTYILPSQGAGSSFGATLEVFASEDGSRRFQRLTVQGAVTSVRGRWWYQANIGGSYQWSSWSNL